MLEPEPELHQKILMPKAGARGSNLSCSSTALINDQASGLKLEHKSVNTKVDHPKRGVNYPKTCATVFPTNGTSQTTQPFRVPW